MFSFVSLLLDKTELDTPLAYLTLKSITTSTMWGISFQMQLKETGQKLFLGNTRSPLKMQYFLKEIQVSVLENL